MLMIIGSGECYLFHKYGTSIMVLDSPIGTDTWNMPVPSLHTYEVMTYNCTAYNTSLAK